MSEPIETKGCYLRAYLPNQPELTLHIESFPCTVGRRDGNGIILNDPSISGTHCRIVDYADEGIVVEDLGSTNGIVANGSKVPRCVVENSVRLLLGNVVVDFALSRQELEGMPPWTPQAQSAKPEAPKLKVVVPRKNEDSFEPSATVSHAAGSGKRGIICPHCWYQFDVSEFLFIARHQSLIGDSVLGSDAQQRFLPSRFTPEGNALDAAGMSCPDMACPRCHLRIPQAASEMPPLFLSIVGATASGKSYFLTSMSWDLRNTLPKNFAIAFTDTDAVNNQILNEFEETMFLASDADELVALRKTELQGELYNQVLLDNMLINLPKPFMFTVTPAEHHPLYEQVKESMSRTLVLYDNAGEHFEPGMDSVDNPTTKHLIHSDTIFFLFDPTKDVRFRKRLTGCDDPQLSDKARVQRQEIILTEMINRIKKYSGMRTGKKAAKTMLLLVSKYDTWGHLLDFDLPEEPWQWEPKFNTCALDIPLIKNVSFAVRQLLDSVCPEVVSTAESFAGEVLYLPVSALGHSPEINEETGMVGIRPRNIDPFWVSVPMLYFFYERGFIEAIPEESIQKHPDTPCQCTLSGDIFFVMLPGERKPLQIPLSFAGCQLKCPGQELWFTLPQLEK